MTTALSEITGLAKKWQELRNLDIASLLDSQERNQSKPLYIYT